MREREQDQNSAKQNYSAGSQKHVKKHMIEILI
jgi:hypothetical protein